MAGRVWLGFLQAACVCVCVCGYVVDSGASRGSNDIILLLQQLQQLHKVQVESDTPQETASVDLPNLPSDECMLPPELKEEIRSYQSVVDDIIDYVTFGNYRGQVYDHLEQLVDTFGPRMTGTAALEAAISWMVERSVEEGLENVHTEAATVPSWTRNHEAAWLTLPRQQELTILGLGGSVGTPPEGITAEVLVVTSFEDLANQSNQAQGKIVVFNPPWVSYDVNAQYRSLGASRAAEKGAVATLVMSVTPFSIDSPHTGQQFYTTQDKIPAACITREDAAMMGRIQARGHKMEVKLVMGAQIFPDTTSMNTVLEWTGGQLPNETVLVSGHLDSWDVGQGAMDDGGGLMISWAAPVVLRRLGLRPRRTLRTVLWTGEEQGLVGSTEYYEKHKDQHEQFQIIMESDSGTFSPGGISFSGTSEATCIMKEVLQLLHRINATQVTNPMLGGPDIGVWQRLGVPTGGLINDNSRYFWFHHSKGDTLSVMDPDALDRCLALWTSVAYVLADMETRLPRPPPTKHKTLDDDTLTRL